MPVAKMWDGSAWVDISVPTTPPANMVTTDTTQTIAGAKTFSSLVTTSADLSVRPGTALATITLADATITKQSGQPFTFNTGMGVQYIQASTATQSNFITSTGAGNTPLVVNLNATNPTVDILKVKRTDVDVLRVTNTGDLVSTGSITSGAGGLWDGVNRAYSDSNPPETLMVTQTASAPATPGAGLGVIYVNSGSLFFKNAAGTAVDLGASGGGGGSSDPLLLATEYNTTTPAAPATGTTVFARRRARGLLHGIGPSGQDTAYQPGLFSNRVARWNAVVGAASGTAAPNSDGFLPTNIAAPTYVPITTGTFFGSMARNRFTSTAATAGAMGGMRSAMPQWFMSSTANLGGFFFVCRFGLNAITVTNRVFVGLIGAPSGAVTPALTNVNPSTFLNMCGFGCDTAQTTLRFFHNDGTGAATAVDLGANFPTTTAATAFYEVRMFVPSGSATSIRWWVTRLDTGQFADGLATTDLPTVGTTMGAHVWHNNGTTATAVSIDLQSLYIESDN